eukprot:SAG22_NODE_1896_length_3362_cov_3.255899_3_plen_75_part_01
MPPTLTFTDDAAAAAGAATVFVVAPASVLKDGSAFGLPALAELVGPAGVETLQALGKGAGGGSVGGAAASSVLAG